MTYEELQDHAYMDGIDVVERPFKSNNIKGLYCNGVVAVNKDIETQKEKSCVLAEEIGHDRTSSGDILDQTDIMNRKQEYRARFYGYNLKIGLTGLIRAYEAGCRNLYEMAEFLDATEEYLREAIQCYRSKYGICTAVDNYIIYFEPFAVMKFVAVE
jgi:Domain of unknown function (DUF955).